MSDDIHSPTTAASFVVRTEARAPMPASSPAQTRRLTTSLSMGGGS